MPPSCMPEHWQDGSDSLPRISCCGDASSSYLMLPEGSPCPKHGHQREEMVLAHMLKPSSETEALLLLRCGQVTQHREEPTDSAHPVAGWRRQALVQALFLPIDSVLLS